MANFALSKKLGLTVAVLLCLATLAAYGADYQLYGFKDNMVPGFALVTLLLSFVHYTKSPDGRRTQDAETLGWQAVFLIIAGVYLARDVYALDRKTVQGVITIAIVLQVINYLKCKARARRSGG